MCLPEAHQRSAVRFSIGYGTTREDVDEAAERIARVVRKLYERLA